MDKGMSETRELRQRALKYERLPSKDLEEELIMMTEAINCLERAWGEISACPQTEETLILKRGIAYDFKRIHRERAYCMRKKFRDGGKNYFEDYAVFIESVYYSQKPLSHFCLRKGELKKWNSLPFDQSGLIELTTRQELKLRWKVLQQRLSIWARG